MPSKLISALFFLILLVVVTAAFVAIEFVWEFVRVLNGANVLPVTPDAVIPLLEDVAVLSVPKVIPPFVIVVITLDFVVTATTVVVVTLFVVVVITLDFVVTATTVVVVTLFVVVRVVVAAGTEDVVELIRIVGSVTKYLILTDICRADEVDKLKNIYLSSVSIYGF